MNKEKELEGKGCQGCVMGADSVGLQQQQRN